VPAIYVWIGVFLPAEVPEGRLPTQQVGPGAREHLCRCLCCISENENHLTNSLNCWEDIKSCSLFVAYLRVRITSLELKVSFVARLDISLILLIFLWVVTVSIILILIDRPAACVLYDNVAYLPHP
jgi:hypothetical protein